MTDHDDPDPLEAEFRDLEGAVEAREAMAAARRQCEREGHDMVEVRSLIGDSFELCSRCGHRPS